MADEFLLDIAKKIMDIHENTAQLNEDARIALIFEKSFRPSFLQCLGKYANADEFLVCREFFVKEICVFFAAVLLERIKSKKRV